MIRNLAEKVLQKKNDRNSLGSKFRNIDEEGYSRNEDVSIDRIYDQDACLGGIHVAEKERFTVSLEANAIEGFAYGRVRRS